MTGPRALGRALPTLAISMGEPRGIGPEVLALALTRPALARVCRPVVFGDRSVLELAARLRSVRLPSALEVVELSRLARDGNFRWGRPVRGGGGPSRDYLEAAVAAVKAGQAQALCTAPIDKELMARAGFAHAGHTEYLREQFGVKRVVMLLAGPKLKVALATVHIPLKDVSAALTRPGLLATLQVLDHGLRQDFGFARPRIAVTGVNPHAGERGLLGLEERQTVAPAVAAARRSGIDAQGPFPADSLFARQLRGHEFDAVLAMHHDQGLGPLKAVDFDRAVNVTLGLPAPRTSPDHGVAFDLAGLGKASPTSMLAALLLGAHLAVRRSAAPGLLSD